MPDPLSRLELFLAALCIALGLAAVVVNAAGLASVLL